MSVTLVLAALVMLPLIFLAGIVITGLNFWVLLSVLVIITLGLALSLGTRAIWRRRALAELAAAEEGTS